MTGEEGSSSHLSDPPIQLLLIAGQPDYCQMQWSTDVQHRACANDHSRIILESPLRGLFKYLVGFIALPSAKDSTINDERSSLPFFYPKLSE